MLSSTVTALIAILSLIASSSAFDGDATYYGGAGNRGACSQNYVPSGFRTVAVSNDLYLDGAACGSCLEGCISKPGGLECFKAIVDNLCKECRYPDLDMGITGDGRFPVKWNYIACPPREPIFSTQGSNQWYGKLKIEGGGPINSVRVNGLGTTITLDAFWVVNDASGNLGCGPKVSIAFASGKTAEVCVPGSLFGGVCSSGNKCGSTTNIATSGSTLVAGANCSNGIPHSDGKTCCPRSCGACGGANCGTFPGGASNCCATQVQIQYNRACSTNPAPCVRK